MELNEREKNIVDLIGKLAEATSDENTTKETIGRIMDDIKKKTQENIKREMEATKSNLIQLPKMKLLEPNIGQETFNMHKQFSDKKCNCYQNQPLLFTRIREVKSPVKAHPTDAGIDFFVPDAKAWTDDWKKMVVDMSRCENGQKVEFLNDGLITVPPQGHVAIPSGIKTIIPQGLAMMMVNKSGVATKMKLDHSACLIDSEYRDELIFCFYNHSSQCVKIEPGMKITQGLIVPVINLKIQECLNCVYDDIAKGSDRGGGFGSSGTK